jgi:aryl-alcohol dehydrogenase-like predicted oxidoreductase
MTTIGDVQLGLGLISIGREWGYVSQPIPAEDDVQSFLKTAVDQGVRVLDTAPSYGYSEGRVGRFLAGLPRELLDSLLIATKAGEHWEPATGALHVDHSYDALAKSIDRSLQLLGRIDLLQLHKANIANVRNPEVKAALRYARSVGVLEIGASVTDVETARVVLGEDYYQSIQFPYHMNNRQMESIFEAASVARKRVLVNRPFGMGELLYDAAVQDRHERRVQAFRSIVERMSAGVVLTGTQSIEHLRENIAAFQQAMQTTAREIAASR